MCLLFPWACLVYTFPGNGAVRYVLFHAWLPALGIMSHSWMACALLPFSCQNNTPLHEYANLR